MISSRACFEPIANDFSETHEGLCGYASCVYKQ